MRSVLLRLVVHDEDDDTCDEMIRDDVNRLLGWPCSGWSVELVDEPEVTRCPSR